MSPPDSSPAPRPARPGLYIAATPIGNARDITLRALDLLRAADLVLCEDTRVTAKLLALYDINVRTGAYHDHNGARMRPRILARLAAGDTIVLVSDAGTPLVSDPGFRLVAAARAAGHYVSVLPGASSALAALLLSGLPCDRFFFAGFLPPRAAARRTALAEIARVPATLVFFESARRLAGALADMGTVLGDRPAAVARELTKKFEEIRQAPLTKLAAAYAEAGPPRGEVVVVVGPPVAEDGAADVDSLLTDAMASMSLKDAVAAVSAATGTARRAVYRRALALSRAARPDGDA